MPGFLIIRTSKGRRHFAYIVRSGKILGYGVNGFSGGRNLSKSAYTTHAEIDSLRHLKKQKNRKRNHIVLISVAHNGTKYMQSKPCKHCCVAMINSGIEWTEYMDVNLVWKKERVSDVLLTAIITSGDKYMNC